MYYVSFRNIKEETVDRGLHSCKQGAIMIKNTP